MLAGTEGASYPFWAPDGRAIRFFAGGNLKRIDLAGGTPQVLADAPADRGGTWHVGWRTSRMNLGRSRYTSGPFLAQVASGRCQWQAGASRDGGPMEKNCSMWRPMAA
jgi:hypothetical protein